MIGFQKKFHVNYRSQIRIFLIFLLIITAQSILNSIFTFPKGDQTNFLFAADQLFNGGKLGIDVWEVKPPLHLFLISIFYTLNKSVLSVHIGELFLNIFAIIFFTNFQNTNFQKKLVFIFLFFIYFFITSVHKVMKDFR